MTPDETKALQGEMVALDTLYVERTGEQPYMSTSLTLYRNGWQAILYQTNSNGGMGDILNAAEEASPQGALAYLRAEILAIPTGQERLLRDAIEKTAATIEAWEKAGVEADYTGVLRSMMTKLSENALTYEAAR